MAKEDIKEMAEKLGIKKENLELGLKKDKKNMEEAIIKAHAFMNRSPEQIKKDLANKKRK